MTAARHPLQPLERATNGVVRFKRNAIVCYLLDKGPFDMNDIAGQSFSQEDREQFAQLIGYSLGGYAELPYVSDATYDAATRQPVHMTDGSAAVPWIGDAADTGDDHGEL